MYSVHLHFKIYIYFINPRLNVMTNNYCIFVLVNLNWKTLLLDEISLQCFKCFGPEPGPFPEGDNG